MASWETLLIILLNLLVVTFIAVGVYLLFILTEIHASLRRTNQLLETAERLAAFLEEKIIKPGVGLVSYLGLAKEFFGVAMAFKNTLKKGANKKK